MSDEATQAVGSTITFASGFFAEITNIDWNGMQRNDIERTNFGTSGSTFGGSTGSGTSTGVFKLFSPSKLIDPGQLDVDIIFNPATPPPINGNNETITIAIAPPLGATTGGKSWACDGYMKGFQYTGPLDDKMTGKATLKFSGPPSIS